MKLGIGLGLAYIIQMNALNPFLRVANDFKERVILGGGTFEAKSCLVDTLTEVDKIPLTAQYLANNLEERVSLDAGTFEAKQCLIDSLNTI